MRKAPKGRINNLYLERLWLLHCALLISIFVSLLVTWNLIAARDILSLTIFLYLCKYIRAHSFLDMYRSIIYWMAGLTLLALSITLIFYVSEYYYGYPDSSWRVSELYLAHGSPVLSRHEYGDFDYHMPLYLSVIPKNIYTLDFPRLPLLFTEPSFFALFCIPLLFAALADKYLKFRVLVVGIFVTGLVVNQSVLGNILLVFVPTGYYLLSLIFRGGSVKFLLFLTVGFFGYLLYSNLSVIISLINLFDTQSSVAFLQNVNGLGDFQKTPFGHVLEEGDEYLRLGAGVVISRYGYVGALLFMAILIQFILTAYSLAAKISGSRFKKACVFSSVTIPALFGLKASFVILAMPLLTVFYFAAYQYEYGCYRKNFFCSHNTLPSTDNRENEKAKEGTN